MESHFALIVNPKSADILTDHNNRLPTVLHDDITTGLNILCENVQRLIDDAYRLIFLRTECEVLKSPADGEQNTFPEHTVKLVIFAIASEKTQKALKHFTWTAREEASRIVVEPMFPTILEFLSEYEKSGLSVNMNRLFPYSHPGWFQEACVWIRNVAARHEICIKNIQQHSSKPQGSVLRAVDKCDTLFYFKHVGPAAVYDEILASLLLSKALPNDFNGPFAVDYDKKWMLMNDRGQSLPEDGCNVDKNRDLFQRVLTTWGKIQIQSISLADELVEHGMERIDGGKLKGFLQEMVSDAEWKAVLSDELSEARDVIGCSADEVGDMLVSYSQWLYGKASAYNIPMTIVHGDLCAANVVLNSNDRFTFIDFSSTCISFPFRDAAYFVVSCEASEDDIGSYFDLWTEYESIERMKELFRIYILLMMLDAVYMSYRFYIIAEHGQRVSTYSDLRALMRILLRKVLAF